MMKAVPKEVIEPMIARIRCAAWVSRRILPMHLCSWPPDEASYITGGVLGVDGMART